MDRLDLRATEGLFAIRSASDTIYIVDTRTRPRLMRLTGPASNSRGWWDNEWAPLVSVVSIIDSETIEDLVIQVGSRVKYLADPGGVGDSNHHFWYSRLVESIDALNDDELAALLAGRAAEDDPVG